MINYIAHWDWILVRSRTSVVKNIKTFQFRAICPNINPVIQNSFDDTINWKIDRTKLIDISGIINLRRILKSLENNEKFHVFTLKSGILFIIANSFLNKNFRSTLSITGLGFIFNKSVKSRLIRFFLKPYLTYFINKTFENIIYQNDKDLKTFNKFCNYKSKTFIVESSGIDHNLFEIKKSFNSPLKVILVGRLLKDKGVFDYIQLIEKYSKSNISFFLAGELDVGNPSSLTDKELDEIKNNPKLKYLGPIDPEKDLHNYDILISLSKSEGFSRILLEAVYVGLFVMAISNSGTIYINQFSNSYLSDNWIDMSEELKKLSNSKLKIDLSNREFVLKNYSSEKVAKDFENIYIISNYDE